MGYVYFLFYRETPISLTSEGLFITSEGPAVIAFTLVYLFSLHYTSLMILLNRNYPFLLFNSINAIGAQIMLIMVDARFAAAYKVMFPSLLLLSLIIFYTILAFRKNPLYLSLAFFLIALSLQERLLTLVGTVILLLSFLHFFVTVIRPQSSRFLTRPFLTGLTVLFLLVTATAFGANLRGYYHASLPQKYNLQAIQQYHKAEKKDVLVLQKVPLSFYGYNLGNWNNMPYFMKQCYRIREDTHIQYIQ